MYWTQDAISDFLIVHEYKKCNQNEWLKLHETIICNPSEEEGLIHKNENNVKKQSLTHSSWLKLKWEKNETLFKDRMVWKKK